MIIHQAFEGERKVCEVTRNRFGHWIIFWPSRNWAHERIANLAAAKQWVAKIMHGKTIVWRKEHSQ